MEKFKELEEQIAQVAAIANADGDTFVARDYKRQKVIERAVEDADDVILHFSDGSVEETDYLTSKVAEAFVKKAHQSIHSRLLKKDLGL